MILFGCIDGTQIFYYFGDLKASNAVLEIVMDCSMLHCLHGSLHAFLSYQLRNNEQKESRITFAMRQVFFCLSGYICLQTKQKITRTVTVNKKSMITILNEFSTPLSDLL